MARQNELRSLMALGSILLVASCAEPPAEDPPPAEEVATTSRIEGSCGQVYGADVCTWATLDGDRIVEFGATIPMASVEGADPEAPFLWPPAVAATVAMPEIVRERYGVTDLKVYWESHGHPPGPYLIPHFDYHFYVKAADEIDAIDCSDTSKPTALPAGYALPDIEIPELGNLVGLCVPEMGMHALLESEMESEETFDGTMVIGYYATEHIFFEPMVSKDLMMAGQSFTLPMPEVPNTGPGVVLPTRFEAVYEPETSAYQFVFSGLPST